MRKYSVFHCYDRRLVANGEYIVQKGDTIYKIARDNGVSVEDIIAANNLTSNLIYPGQIILIPKTVPSGGVYFEEYEVQSNETLESIAAKMNIRLDLLTKYNDIAKIVLGENQIIKIPRQYQLYTIKPEDTLESILMATNMTIEELIKANIDTWLQVGTTINVK